MSDSFVQKVKSDLLRVGISNYAIHRSECRHLAAVLREDETIHGAVFGRTPEGAALLVATNRRVIYYQKTPLLATVDDITYEVVSGLMVGQVAGLFATVVLKTRIGDYTIRYVNLKSARIFKEYLEKSRLEGEPQGSQQFATTGFGMSLEAGSSRVDNSGSVISQEAAEFLSQHDLGVLSTLDRNGSLSGAAVYYLFHKSLQTLNILTKTETKKAQNIVTNHTVAFTIYDKSALQTVQLQAVAEIEPDQIIRQQVYEHISKPHNVNSVKVAPPVTSLQQGSFTVLRLTPTTFEYRDYKTN